MTGFAAAQEAGRLPGSVTQTRAMWSLPPGPDIIASVRRHLALTADGRGNWPGWSPAERADFVRVVFRPLVAAESLVQELVLDASNAAPGNAVGGGNVGV